MKKIIWFGTKLTQSGGGERLSLEVIKSLSNQGYETNYLAYHYHSHNVFDGVYDNLNINAYSHKLPINKFVSPFHRRIWLYKRRFWLRKKIKEIKPDLIITTGTWSQVSELYLATLGMNIDYIVHIFGSLFAFPPERETTKFASIFSKNFLLIRNSVPSYKEVVPLRNPDKSIRKFISNEISACIKYFAVRKAKEIFVLSKRNQLETQLLYKRLPLELHGAFPYRIFDHKPVLNFKNKLNLDGKKIILSVSRLSSNKRVDLCIKSFAVSAKKNPDIFLLIGGTGPEEASLKILVKELLIESQVKFIGYIPDNLLWDYLSICDVFISLDLADFDIAPLEALALGKNVIWADEMELNDIKKLLPNSIFSVNSDINFISKCLITAINNLDQTDSPASRKAALSYLSWENYSKVMVNNFFKSNE